jgi:hypothetical protein
VTQPKTPNEQLLDEGPRTAPEPETAEQRTSRRKAGAAAGTVAATGAVLAKAGLLGKVVLGLVAWHGFFAALQAGAWWIAGVVAAVLAVALVVLARRGT